MKDGIDMNKARSVYSTLVRMLDTRGWHYDKIEDEFMIKSGVKGDDLPVEFIVVVKPDKQVVQFFSVLPFNMPEDKRIDGAIAICVANYGLCDGSFDYDISDGKMIYRLTCSYRESILGEDLFEYMIMVAAGTVDRYNDRFFMLSKNMLTIQQFIEQENN